MKYYKHGDGGRWCPPWFRKYWDLHVEESWPDMINNMMAGKYRVRSDDLTFIIPYGLDMPIRFDNLIDCLFWIHYHTNSKIQLYISDTKESLEKDLVTKNLHKDHSSVSRFIFTAFSKYFHKWSYNETTGDPLIKEELFSSSLENFSNRISIIKEVRGPGERFHRTRYLNEMLNRVDTPFVCNHDVDVLLSKQGIRVGLELLRSGYEVVYPQGNGKHSIAIPEHSRNSETFKKTMVMGDFSCLIPKFSETAFLLNTICGHSIFFNTDSYKMMKGENEDLKSYAPDDIERYLRAHKFGLKISRVPIELVHLEHGASIESGDQAYSQDYFKKNTEVWESIMDMSKEELQEYYRKLPYVNKYGWHMEKI